MDKLLLDYISVNQIFSFIYAIKSDNAGGVQEDRVSKLSLIVLSQRKYSRYSHKTSAIVSTFLFDIKG